MSAVQVRRWTRAEYERLAEVGILRPDEHVELIEGEIVEMTLQHSRHATAIRLVEDALRAVFREGYDVRAQLPLALDAYSEPEPDVAVVPGRPRDYADAHPTSAVLVVEIADTTLAFDRETKASVYAKAGIPEYWIVNLTDRQLEIHREPGPIPALGGGFGYHVRQIAAPGEEVSPLSRPDARLAIAELLP